MKIHSEKYWDARIAKIFARREKELSTKLARLKKRRRDGWGYRRVYIHETKVRKYTRAGHYANVMVKIR